MRENGIWTSKKRLGSKRTGCEDIKEAVKENKKRDLLPKFGVMLPRYLF